MEEIDYSSSFDSDRDYSNHTHNSSKKFVRQFYFVKFHPSFVDPTLKEKIENAQEFRKKMDEAKTRISNEISLLEENRRNKSAELRWYDFWNGSSRVQFLKTNIRDWQRQLQIQWPHNHNDIDLELDLKMKIEATKEEDVDMNIDERIEELSKKLNHGKRNLAEERRMVRELKEMKKSKDKIAHHGETKPMQMFDWNSKEAIQERLLRALKELRKIEEQGRKLSMEFKAIKAETQRKVAPLQKKEAEMNQKKARANQYILEAKMQLTEQAACYNEYMAFINDAKELAKNKDFIALEGLSYQQVESFMSCWNEDELFRANYKRSGTSSFRDRMLSSDGRIRNFGENF